MLAFAAMMACSQASYTCSFCSVTIERALFAMQRCDAVKRAKDLTKQNEILKHEVTPCTLNCEVVVLLQISIVNGSCRVCRSH